MMIEINRYLLLKFLIFSILGLICTNNPIQAQKLEISESLDIGKDVKNMLIGSYDNNLLLYRHGRSKHYVQAFDSNLTISWRRELNYPKHIVRVVDIIPDKTHFTILYSFYGSSKTELRALKLSPKAETIKDFRIAEFNGSTPYESLKTVWSEDKQQVVVYSVEPTSQLNWVCFDLAEQKSHWMLENSFKEINFGRDFRQILVNNASEVFLISERNNNKRNKEVHYFEITKIGVDNKDSSSFKIEFPDLLTYDSKFVYDELNKQLVGGGLFAQNSYNAHGLFYTSTNMMDSALLKTELFDETFIRSLTGEKRKKLDGISNLEMRELILRRDGGVVFVAEQNFKYEYQLAASYYQDIPAANRQADYLYENVLMASIHPTGEVHWKTVLYKSQSSENDEARYSSFFLLRNASNLRVLYNDDIRWTSTVFEYVVNGLGEVQRNAIFDPHRRNILPEFRKAVQIGANEVAAISIRNHRLKLLKISF